MKRWLRKLGYQLRNVSLVTNDDHGALSHMNKVTDRCAEWPPCAMVRWEEQEQARRRLIEQKEAGQTLRGIGATQAEVAHFGAQ
jgi:hypothetical protein